MAELKINKIALAFFLVVGMGSGAAAFGMDLPETVVLNSLSHYYDGVSFDHALHEQVADCAACHHHTTGMPSQDPSCMRCHAAPTEVSVVACRDCHSAEPFSAGYLKAKKADTHRYHTDKLGLKGAYHQSCLGCHQAMGAPSGCMDCHPRNPAGDALFQAGGFSSAGPAASR